MIETKFNRIIDDWKVVKNHCRTTVNKKFSEKDATDTFKKKLLIAEHSPIRLIEFDWSWENMPYWVSTELSRHKHEKFISSQRNDRQSNYDRNEARQDSPVKMDNYANMQQLIDISKKRLCHAATDEARSYMENFKYELAKTHPVEASVLVPTCIYSLGCREMSCCGLIGKFLNYAKEKGYKMEDLVNIQTRYDIYNEFFKENYENMGAKEEN